MDRQEIGQFIQEQRKLKKFTQQQLADNCGLSRDTILNVEKGNVNITIDALLSIMEVLSAKIEVQAAEFIMFDMEAVGLPESEKIIMTVSKEPDTYYIYDFSKIAVAKEEEKQKPVKIIRKKRITPNIKLPWE